MSCFIAYDLGTGGVKASLFDSGLNVLANSFIEYKTSYPKENYHQQEPQDWWNGIVRSTKVLLETTDVKPEEIECLALSGHSLVAIPFDRNGHMLMKAVPIWSDTRAQTEAADFFERYDEEKWYMQTGNGFPAACYPLFKLMWLKKNMPEIYANTYKVLGSKDYINFCLTGKMYMDYSYASGTGAYNLKEKSMSEEILDIAEISKDIFPEIVPSDMVIGTVLPEAAAEIGLCAGTKVACGGVDNACMALGCISNTDGNAYTSLGSSSWIAVNSKEPILDFQKKPYVFAHIDDNMYTSAFSIFAGGSSLRWVRDTLCQDLLGKEDPYGCMTREMLSVPVGADGVIFNPSLAGGTSQDKSLNIRGAYLNLSLGTGRAEIIRATMEGIAMNLKISLENLKEHTYLSDEIQFCGGGARNRDWMQIFANIFGMTITKTNIDQNAASIGAAAIAAKAIGAIKDYQVIEGLHKKEFECMVQPEEEKKYKRLLGNFCYATTMLADFGDYVKRNKID